MKIRMILYLLIWMLGIHNIYAASNKYGIWSTLKFSGTFKHKPFILYDTEFEARFKNENNFFDEAVIHGALGCALNNISAFFIGVSLLPDLGISNRDDSEYRIWQQLTIKPRFEQSIFSSRTRVEERKKNSNQEIAVRLRQQFALKFQRAFVKKFMPILSDEIFINANQVKWVNTTTISQNRLRLGVYKKYRSFVFTIGYLNVALFKHEKTKLTHILFMRWKF